MLKRETKEELDLLIQRYPCLTPLRDRLLQSVEQIKNSYQSDGKVLVCGNGGSAADSLHIVGELMKSFVGMRDVPSKLLRQLRENYPADASFYEKNLQGALPAIALVNEVSLMTAFGNDKSAELVFGQQVLGYGKPGDVLLAISTSGNSMNVVHAARIAKCMGLCVISLTGSGGGMLKELSDILLSVPSDVTYQIQELHLPIYHALCLAIEKEIFTEQSEKGRGN